MQAWHLWALAAIALVIVEMLSPLFFFASFGAAALATSAAAAAGLGFTGQLAVFAVASVLCIFAVRPLFAGWIYRRSEPAPVNVQALVGQTGVVVDEIQDGLLAGRVKIGGEEWRAVSGTGERLPAGARVEVTAVSSATLTVVPCFSRSI